MKLKDWWVLFPCLPFYAAVLSYARNLPWLDDYETVLQTVIDFRSGGLWEKVLVIFRQHTEHRIVWARMAVLAYYYVFGNINFRNLIIIGDLQLLVVAIIGIYFITKYVGKYWQLFSFLFCLCLYDENSYEAAIWTTVALQGYGVIMLFMLSMFLWHKQKVALACVFQFLLILSSGNGMIGAVLILLYLIAVGIKKHATLSASVSFLAIMLYFCGYVIHDDPNRLPFDAATVVVYFIREMGVYFDFDLSFIFGSALLSVLGYVYVHQKVGRAGWPICLLLYFSICSLGMTALFRSCMKGAQFQTSRYLIYGEIIVGLVLVMAAAKLPEKKRIWLIVAAFCILLPVYAKNYRFGQLGFMRYEMRIQIYQYWHPDPKKAEQIAKEADADGIYSLEDNR